ncbi:hypothetical protein RFI_16402 [Reticulomyxa filosa]|uniref:TFIIS N-terminal domain-containing protein n=1 Tax=Reticulomyxa filosa TaxID=46433 RepID=X6N4Y4_RETFI|nr:hypothetical protein RFI_16402 [Reticulomyxa filosa]|eukprot:ETO20814.1 hypothetical protein RFI_16402 [Reticulomyxa filosa]
MLYGLKFFKKGTHLYVLFVLLNKYINCSNILTEKQINTEQSLHLALEIIYFLINIFWSSWNKKNWIRFYLLIETEKRIFFSKLCLFNLFLCLERGGQENPFCCVLTFDLLFSMADIDLIKNVCIFQKELQVWSFARNTSTIVNNDNNKNVVGGKQDPKTEIARIQRIVENLMNTKINYEILKTTKIGATVNGLILNRSNDLSDEWLDKIKTLIDSWKRNVLVEIKRDNSKSVSVATANSNNNMGPSKC